MSITAGRFLSTRQTAPHSWERGTSGFSLGPKAHAYLIKQSQVPLPISWIGWNSEMDGEVRPEPLLGSALIRGGDTLPLAGILPRSAARLERDHPGLTST